MESENITQLAKLVDMENPVAVLDEVESIISEIYTDFNFTIIKKVYNDVIDLFNGDYKGYNSCNTGYHNLEHTTATVMTFARLLHGAYLNNMNISKTNALLGFIASILHDTGYIQTINEKDGTGAQFTLTHVKRSIDFSNRYFSKKSELEKEQLKTISDIIWCTDIQKSINDINFSNEDEKLIGAMVGTADLLGQMADRVYLEKLLFLYIEFKEGNVPGYENEEDMLVKTIDFYLFVERHLKEGLDDVRKFMLAHFQDRWDTDYDLYQIEITKNIEYLKKIMSNKNENYRTYLRRNKIVTKIISLEQKQL